MHLKLFDFAAALLSITIIVLVLLVSFQNGTDGKQVYIVSGDSEYYYQLDENRTINIPGPFGVTTIEIEDESISVTDSPCPDKICIHQGKINQPGQWIACLPNEILITITGKTEEFTDEISF